MRSPWGGCPSSPRSRGRLPEVITGRRLRAAPLFPKLRIMPRDPEVQLLPQLLIILARNPSQTLRLLAVEFTAC